MPDNLRKYIRPNVKEIVGANGAAVLTIEADDIHRIANELNLSLKQVEITCLQDNIVPTRYLRNQATLGSNDQIRLLNAKAAVIGLGGLGGLVVETLTRVGVGNLVLIDGDVFEDHNLNRQLLSTSNRIGQSKAETAAKRVKEVNAAVELDIFSNFLTAENAIAQITGCDVVVDCLDNIISRFDLEKAAKKSGIPMVSAAVAGITGHVTTIFPKDPGLELIYGPCDKVQKSKGAEATLGCLPQAVYLISAVESSEAIKIILNQNQEILRNKLWVVDLTNNTFEVLKLS